MRILVSACLLGENCKYNGGNNDNPAVCRLAEEHELVPFCPERAGGLPCPRPPAEKRGGGVWDKTGKDVTAAFRRGAEQALRTALEQGCKTAILKARSPSCGSGEIYDGTFTGTVVPGDGVAAAKLKAHRIVVLTEEELDKL